MRIINNSINNNRNKKILFEILFYCHKKLILNSFTENGVNAKNKYRGKYFKNECFFLVEINNLKIIV